MTQDSRRRRTALRRYPRRSAATFSDDNDHNPVVLQDCPACSGSGKSCRHIVDGSGETYALEVCSACSGTGVTGDVEPYFPDVRPEVTARADDTGWITCPSCDWRFALRDRRAWTGRRHVQCGQKIRIVDA